MPRVFALQLSTNDAPQQGRRQPGHQQPLELPRVVLVNDATRVLVGLALARPTTTAPNRSRLAGSALGGFASVAAAAVS